MTEQSVPVSHRVYLPSHYKRSYKLPVFASLVGGRLTHSKAALCFMHSCVDVVTICKIKSFLYSFPHYILGNITFCPVGYEGNYIYIILLLFFSLFCANVITTDISGAVGVPPAGCSCRARRGVPDEASWGAQS